MHWRVLFSQRSVEFEARSFGLSVVNHDCFSAPHHSVFPREGILRKKKEPQFPRSIKLTQGICKRNSRGLKALPFTVSCFLGKISVLKQIGLHYRTSCCWRILFWVIKHNVCCFSNSICFYLRYVTLLLRLLWENAGCYCLQTTPIIICSHFAK